MQNVKPLKRFGQNYLHDKNILKKIVGEINPQPNETILEVGPGKGALTEYLYEKTGDLLAVEIDKRVIDYLRNRYPAVKIIQADFLKLDLRSQIKNKSEQVRIVGNIPYNITSSIIFKIMNDAEFIKDAVLMVQYEVAKRMTANKGTKDYGILSVLLKYFSETKLCFKVSPNAFYPKPKITSAVVHIKLKKMDIDEKDREFFIKTVKACFGNRRKTLKNSLSNSIFNELNFLDTGIDLSMRAEQLDVEEFVTLAKFARNQFGRSGSAS
ncbi:ribosomal RNA small subunit methyltransferase A [bacterium BMS3Abin03]|nr:ribosomal RNA small subunit methyltransferase A [bacterium BMS3Abin03]